MAPFVEVFVVQPGRAQAGIELSIGVPLKAALVIDGRPPVLLIRFVFVNVAELVGGVVDLVALGITGQELLKENLGPTLIVDVIGAPALILVGHASPIEIVSFGDVIGGLEGGRRNIQLQSKGLLGNSVKLQQLFFGPASAFHVADR